MSVNFKVCECCDDDYYEEYVGKCDKCGHSLCTDCLVNKGDLNSDCAYEYNVRYNGTKE